MDTIIYEQVFEELNPEEDKTAQLVAYGFEEKQVSEIKIRALGTIRTQVNSIFRKLNVNNKVKLALKYAEKRRDKGLPIESAYIITSTAAYKERIERERARKRENAQYSSIAFFFLCVFSFSIFQQGDMRRARTVRERMQNRVEVRARIREYDN
ncbi:MAG: response regulator transcription factor [Bacteroidales bacterium]|nr:response regulator transcription factor [Bacteroidales bacterium]